jgi:TRAP-type C4-dicarboxylate transport system substrate-binding protein
MKKLSVALMFLAVVNLLAFANNSTAADKKVILKLEHDNSAGSLEDTLWKEAAETLKQRSNGTLLMEVYASCSLSGNKITTMVQNIRLGSTQMGSIASSVYSGMVKEYGVFALPFITDNMDEMKKIARGNSPLAKKLHESNEFRGIKMIETHVRLPRQLLNNKKTIRTPEDIVGMTFRVSETPVWVDTFKAWKANPLAMPFSDVPMAMSTGAVDGADRPTGHLSQEAWWDLGKFATLIDYASDVEIVGINVNVWNSLSPDQQKILQTLMTEVADERQIREEADGEKSIDLLRSHGVEVIKLTKEERDRFREKSMPVWDKFDREIGGGLIDEALSILGKKR